MPFCEDRKRLIDAHQLAVETFVSAAAHAAEMAVSIGDDTFDIAWADAQVARNLMAAAKRALDEHVKAHGCR
jgi:hypothetical protein